MEATIELKPHLALFYDYVENALEARKPFREAHLDAARAAKDAGLLVASGALGDPPHGGLFIFASEDRAVVERFVAADPYVVNGIVISSRVEVWNVVV